MTLVAALVAGSVAVIQLQRSRAAQRDAETAAAAEAASRHDAEIDTLVERIATLRPTQREAAALLAVEAFRLADTPRTRAALLSTFTTDPGFFDTHRLPQNSDVHAGIVLPDGDHALVVERDHRLRPYNLETGALGAPWPAASDANLPNTTVLTASPDGRLLAHVANDYPASAAVASTVSVYDINLGRARFPAIDVPTTVGNAAFSTDGTMLAVSGGADETVIVFATDDGHELGRTTGSTPLNGDIWETAGLAFLDDHTLAIGSAAGPVRIVDVPSMHAIDDIDAPRGTTNHLTAFDDGRRLLANGWSGTTVLDVGSGGQRWSTDSAGVPCVRSAVIESAGTLYCADAFGQLVERDLTDGHVVRRLDPQTGAVGSLWPARDGTDLVIFNGDGTSVSRWRIDGTGPIVRRLPPGYVPLGYSPDGRLLVALAATDDPDAIGDVTIGSATVGASLGAAATVVLDSVSGTVVDRIDGLVRPVWHDNDSLSGLLVADAGLQPVRYDLTTRSFVPVGDVLPTARMIGGLDDGGPRAFAYYIDGPSIEIRSFDTATGQPLGAAITRDDGIAGSAASTDGSRLAIARDDVWLYDSTTGDEVGRIDGDHLLGVHITASGVLVAWSDGQLATYDLATLAPLHAVPIPHSSIVRAESDAAGSTLATIDDDGRVMLFDVATTTELSDAIEIDDEDADAMALRPDGLELVLGGSRATGMQVWDLDPEHWIDAACRLAGRNLTEQEWSSAIGDLAPYQTTCEDVPAAASTATSTRPADSTAS